MIRYVVAGNPDERVIVSAVNELREGNVIAFPTDTSWVFAANLLSKKGVDSLYQIREVDRKKHLSIICDSISMASKYAIISNNTYRMINRLVPGAYTFILNPSRDIPRSIRDYKKSKQIGIRIPKSILCQKIIKSSDFPIITTSIPFDGILQLDGESRHDTIYSYQIEEMFGGRINMIIDPDELELLGKSSIIDFSEEDEVPRILREGAGDVSFFRQ